MLENGMADVVQWTMATAAANKLNVVRSFAHGVDGSFPLQIKAGQHSAIELFMTVLDRWAWLQSLLALLCCTAIEYGGATQFRYLPHSHSAIAYMRCRIPLVVAAGSIRSDLV